MVATAFRDKMGDNRGRATEIKNTITAGMLDYDRFKENLTYNLNSNISTQSLTYYVDIPGYSSLSFSYSYYNNNRLASVNCNNPNYFQQYIYDRDGNFTMILTICLSGTGKTLR